MASNERSDGASRSPAFGALVEANDRRGRSTVMMELDPQRDGEEAAWALTCKHWLELPVHAHLFEPVRVGSRGELVLRYTAPPSDWSDRAVEADPIASWGVALTRVFDFLSLHLPRAALGWFARPFVELDVGGELRVGFLPATGSAVSSEALVRVIGELLRPRCARGDASSFVAMIVARCCEDDPRHRYRTLRDLREAFIAAGGSQVQVSSEAVANRDRRDAELGRHALAALTVARAPAPALRPRPDDDPDALRVRCNDLVTQRQYEAALRSAARWIVIAPADARAHHAHGRCLLLVRRLIEARASFDRACQLDPQLLVAMLLRREVDRCLRHVRTQVGIPKPEALDVPPHLAALAVVIASGRTDDALGMLASPEYGPDPAAQLLVAHCLRFARRFADAIEAFDRAGHAGDHRHAAMVGKADALLELGQPDAARQLFAQVLREAPDDRDAIEGHAMAVARCDGRRDADM